MRRYSDLSFFSEGQGLCTQQISQGRVDLTRPQLEGFTGRLEGVW
jgi:hypothetical protein